MQNYVFLIDQKLAKIYPQKARLKGSDGAFNVEAFARAGHCTVFPSVQTRNQGDTGWNWSSNELYQIMKKGSLQIKWQENLLDAILISSVKYFWILADTRKVAEDFLRAVCKWNSEIRSDNEILEFLGGCLRKNPKLSRDIKDTTLS